MQTVVTIDAMKPTTIRIGGQLHEQLAQLTDELNALAMGDPTRPQMNVPATARMAIEAGMEKIRESLKKKSE